MHIIHGKIYLMLNRHSQGQRCWIISYTSGLDSRCGVVYPDKPDGLLVYLGSHPETLFRKQQPPSKDTSSITLYHVLTSTDQLNEPCDVARELNRWSTLINQTLCWSQRWERRKNIFSIEKSLQCHSLLFFQWKNPLQFCHNWSYSSIATYLFRSRHCCFQTAASSSS